MATNDVLPHGRLVVSSLIATLFCVLGYGVVLWRNVVNPFPQKTTRIQVDHQKYVIQTGPYAFMRHPRYVGVIAILLATPVMLDSRWTLIPSI